MIDWLMFLPLQEKLNPYWKEEFNCSCKTRTSWLPVEWRKERRREWARRANYWPKDRTSPERMMIDWLIDWLIDQLIDWLIDWLISWFVVAGWTDGWTDGFIDCGLTINLVCHVRKDLQKEINRSFKTTHQHQIVSVNKWMASDSYTYLTYES